jgi:plasmid stability protein
MADVLLRNLDDWVVSWYRAQGKKHGMSLEDELRHTLKHLVAARKRRIVRQLRADLKRLEMQFGLFSDSAELIRQDREERG